MSARPGYFKIGLFVISATIIAVIGVVVLGAGTLFRKKVMVETYFRESVQGLDVGSQLKFRGFRIGKIQEIAIVGREYLTDRRYIIVRAVLFPDAIQLKTGEVVESTIQKEVERGLRARLGFQGLTGTTHLELDYVDPKDYSVLKIDWKPRYVYIPSTPSTITRVSVALDKIMKSLEKVDFQGLMKNLESASKDIGQFLQHANVGKISEQAEKLLAEVRQNNQRIGQILESHNFESILSDTSATMAKARRILEDAERPLSNLLRSLKGASQSISKLSRNLESLSRDMPEGLDHLKSTLRRLDQLVSSQQQDIEVSIQNIRVTTENLREFSEIAKRYPSQILFGEPPKRSEGGR